jgi:predicted PurR-regulated permease PerM
MKKVFEFSRLSGLAYFVVVLCTLYWGKDFLLPIILAALVSFLLTPAVIRLERIGAHPFLAVMGTVVLAVVLCGTVVATVSVEAVDLINSIPKYRENIDAKWIAIQKGPPGPLNLAFRNVGELASDLAKITRSAGSGEQPEPTKVEVVGGGTQLVSLLKTGMAPVAGPVGELALVVVLVVFMLVERKRFRQRLLALVGHSRLAKTSLAIDEAGFRLSKFLLVQLQVNTGFALVLGVGLYLIGIPNAMLWGVLTLVLRFLPYIGIWISAFFTLALSLAISATWREPILVATLYVVLELFTNNVVEPFALAGSTGMSPLAVIVSALFWTWLWGPVGLLLATPLTACLVTLGYYFPGLYPWSVLLASRPPTTAELRLILLLTEGRIPDARALMHESVGMQLSLRSAEDLIIPAIRAIENDLFPGSTAIRTKSRIYEQLRLLIDELNIPSRTTSDNASSISDQQESGLVVLPFVGEGDELVGDVLVRLLGAEGISSVLIPWRTLRSDKLRQLQELGAKCVVIVAIEARSAMSVAKMARSIQTLLRDAVIVIGLWSLPMEGSARLVRKIKESQGWRVYTDFEQAVQGIGSVIIPARLKQDRLSAESGEAVRRTTR